MVCCEGAQSWDPGPASVVPELGLLTIMLFYRNLGDF